MSVPSVATSISPTSASSIFSSQSYSTESTMVTPTQGLVSQQILTVPSSSTIVDMATLNSLNMHSCNGTNLVCRNAHSLPSQESSFPVDPDPCISNVTTSTMTSLNESSVIIQEIFKSSSLANSCHSIPKSNCIYETSKQHNPTSTAEIGARESNANGVSEKADRHKNFSFARTALSESYPLMSGSKGDSNVGCKLELENLNACYCSARIKRLRDPSTKQVVNYSSIIFDNEEIPPSLKPSPKLPYAKEDQNDNTLIFHCCKGDVQDAHVPNTSLSVCSSCTHDNLFMLSRELKKQSLEGQFNCGILNQKSSYKLLSTQGCSKSNLNESSELENYPSWGLSSLSDMPFRISCRLPQEKKRLHNGYIYSGANILSLPSLLVDEHLNILKLTLAMDPLSKISSNGFCEYLSPKMVENSNLASINSGNNGLNNSYLCCELRKRWFEEQLVLVLAEVPAFAEQFSLDLSEIMQQVSHENLSFSSKAVFMKKCSGISSADSSKNGILRFIKIVSAKKYFNSAEESAIADINFPCDQMFAKIIPAADIIIKLDSSSLNNILPINGIKPEEEDSLSGFISCLIVPSEKYLAERELPLPSKDDEKPLYVGLLVPSTKLLHSLNISIYQKDSLGVRLGSSRPNQQYSTHTSVDLQSNGNNVEFIPIIPLGMYSQSESSYPDLKFLTPVAESSYRDVHNIEDIFLINNGSREEILNPGETSQKEIGFADIFSSKSSLCDSEAHVRDPKELKKYHCFTTSDPPESISKGKMYSSLQPNILLECLGEMPKNDCADSNDIFYTVSMAPEKEIKRKNENRCTRMPGETTLNIIQLQQDKVCEKNGLASPSGESFLEASGFSLKPKCCYEDGKSTILLPHLSHEIQPTSEGFLLQECESRVFSEELEIVEEWVDSISGQNSANLSSVNFTSVLSQPKNKVGGSLCSELQTNNEDLQGLETVNSNCYSMKRKIHNKRSEGYLKPFRISRMNRNKPIVDLRKAREIPVEEKIVKMRDDMDSKLCAAVKSTANSWKHYPYGSNCLSMIKNIVSSSTHINSMQNAMEDRSKKVEENNRSFIHKVKYKADCSASVAPKFSRYGEFPSRGRGRQTSSFKSPDRKFGRNFFLSTSGSAKRSKLTILIFCLAVTSLLISLHALSTDSSLYIKPTFFLVQEEEDTSASSFSSESSYLKKSSLDQSENGEIGGLMVASGPIYRSILVKEEIGVVKEEKGADRSVTYIKSRKDTLNWTRSGVDESLVMKSKNGILGEIDLKRSSFKMAEDRNSKESKQFSGVVKNILDSTSGKNGSLLKPSISKAAFYFLNNENLTNLKTNPSSAVGKNTEEVSNSIIRNSEHMIQHSSVPGNNVEQHVKSITDSGIGSSSSADHTDVEGNVIGDEVGAQKTSSIKDNRGVGLSSTKNLTKLTPYGEGTSSNHNDFDLNIAFIEKNELNAAYGIDSGTTGAEGNFEEDYIGEEDMTQMATSGNRVKFPKASRRLPQALIIGVRKGGTRALLEMLHLHPLVQKAAGEAHFFDRDENYAKGLQWYRRRMPPSLKGQITVEKSPSYFVTPEVPERVRAMNASIRLLLIVREPVTRAISDFAQLRSHSLAAKANTTIRTKLDGVDEDYGKKVTRPLSSFESLAILPDGRVDMSWRPISVSLYHRHISAWLEAFPRDQILIVDGDQLASNPAPVLASVEKFLKLRPALTPTHFYFNATKGFYCLRSLPPGQPVDGMAMMPSSLSQSSLPEGKCLRESKGRRHPHVDPSVVHKLRRFFAEHNRRFYEMVGEDFGWPEE